MPARRRHRGHEPRDEVSRFEHERPRTVPSDLLEAELELAVPAALEAGSRNTRHPRRPRPRSLRASATRRLAWHAPSTSITTRTEGGETAKKLLKDSLGVVGSAITVGVVTLVVAVVALMALEETHGKSLDYVED